MKKIFIASILFYSFQGFSEEYFCSGIVGDETQIKSYERKGDYFLYTTRGWEFKILHEDERNRDVEEKCDRVAKTL